MPSRSAPASREPATRDLAANLPAPRAGPESAPTAARPKRQIKPPNDTGRRDQSGLRSRGPPPCLILLRPRRATFLPYGTGDALGSRLLDRQSRIRTVAANATVDGKVFAHRPQRVRKRRPSLRRPQTIPPQLLRRKRRLSCLMSFAIFPMAIPAFALSGGDPAPVPGEMPGNSPTPCHCGDAPLGVPVGAGGGLLYRD